MSCCANAKTRIACNQIAQFRKQLIESSLSATDIANGFCWRMQTKQIAKSDLIIWGI